MLTKKMTVYAPLCANHKNHWFVRNLVIFGGFAGLSLIGIAALLVILIVDQNGRGGNSALTGMVCGGPSLLLLAWLFTVAILQSTAIRPTEITDNAVNLIGVSAKFVEALEGQEEWASRPTTLTSDDDIGGIDDLGPPRRRRPPSDSFREEN